MYFIIPLTLLLVGFIPLYFFQKKKYSTWKQMLFGGLVWIISVGLKSIFAALFNEPINIILVSIWMPFYYVYIGLLTGFFEIFIPLFIISKYKSKFENLNHKIGFGLGFGSVEAIFIGLLTIISFLVATNFSSSIPVETLQSFSGSNFDFISRAVYGGVERISATMIHVFCMFMIFLFTSTKKARYLIVPILLKTLTDGLSLYFVVAETPPIIFESIYLALGIAATIIMVKIIKSENMKLTPVDSLSSTSSEKKKSKNIFRILASRLFVALIVFGVVGIVLLFGKDLPSSAAPFVYLLVGVTFLVSLYVYLKKPELLKNKFVLLGLAILIIVGSTGWITAIPEITDCRPYKCNDEFICAKPTELGLKISTGECTSDFPEEINFSCENDGNSCITCPIE
jgi:uncharacterized membrane protein YhfC